MLSFETLELIGAFTFFGLIASVFVCLLLLKVTLVSRAGAALKQHCGLDDNRHWAVLAGNYSRYIVFHAWFKRDYSETIDYRDFNFKGFASPFETLVSYVFWCSFLCLVGFTVVVNLADWLGYIELS